MKTQEQPCLKRILCVEDDEDTCEMLGFLLDEYDFTYTSKTEEAISKIETEKYDLYILDNWLPGTSGVELCRKIRSVNADVPIIFTSGYSDKDNIQKALDAGANKYLVKPCDPEELLNVVKELINK